MAGYFISCETVSLITACISNSLGEACSQIAAVITCLVRAAELWQKTGQAVFMHVLLRSAHIVTKHKRGNMCMKTYKYTLLL